MTYRIPLEFWTLGNDGCFITDDQGNKKFRIVGTAFDWGTGLSLQDLEGDELAAIGQEMMSMSAVYTIHRNGKAFAEVRREWEGDGKIFQVDLGGKEGYIIDGRFSEYEFHFTRQKKVVAQVSKVKWGWTDSYGVEISPGEDDVTILCTTLIIDEILFEQNRKM